MQKELLQVSFLGIFRATTPPHNFLMATFSLFVTNLSAVKRKYFRRFESLMFAVKVLENSAVVCIVPLCFEHVQQFHILFITSGIIWSLIIVEAVNNALKSYIKLCNYVMLNSSEPIKGIQLQKLAYQSVLNDVLVIDK